MLRWRNMASGDSAIDGARPSLDGGAMPEPAVDSALDPTAEPAAEGAGEWAWSGNLGETDLVERLLGVLPPPMPLRAALCGDWDAAGPILGAGISCVRSTLLFLLPRPVLRGNDDA